MAEFTDKPSDFDQYPDVFPADFGGQMGEMTCLDCFETWSDADNRTCPGCGSQAVGLISEAEGAGYG